MDGGTPEVFREPCPDRILDFIGGYFKTGAVGGTAFYFLQGMYPSPNGARFIGGSQAVRMNVPRLSGRFAVWGGLFSAFDCTLFYLRQKEDSWNSIMAGAAASGSFQMRQGLGRVSKSALLVGTVLAFIEGGCIMINKVLSDVPQKQPRINKRGGEKKTKRLRPKQDGDFD